MVVVVVGRCRWWTFVGVGLLVVVVAVVQLLLKSLESWMPNVCELVDSCAASWLAMVGVVWSWLLLVVAIARRGRVVVVVSILAQAVVVAISVVVAGHRLPVEHIETLDRCEHPAGSKNVVGGAKLFRAA